MAEIECILCDCCGGFMRRESDQDSSDYETELYSAISKMKEDYDMCLDDKDGNSVLDLCSLKCALKLMNVDEYFLLFMYTYNNDCTPTPLPVSMEGLTDQNHDWYVWDCWYQEFRNLSKRFLLSELVEET